MSNVFIFAMWSLNIGNESLVLAFEQQAQDLRQLKTEFGDLKEELRKRKLLDSYRFAEIAENEDFKLNTANSNRVMVTGNLIQNLIQKFYNTKLEVLFMLC